VQHPHYIQGLNMKTMRCRHRLVPSSYPRYIMNKLFSAFAVAFTFASISGTSAAAGGAPAATALHPALLAAPVYAAHADATRLVPSAGSTSAAVTALHPALLGAPTFAAHADASALKSRGTTPTQVVERAE
jgi:hypothetical protein